jgi:hypothetical protein
MMKPFKELSEDRQFEIVENSMGDDWHESIIEDIKAELEELGISEPDIQFSGFWSQGDGASFTCDGVDLIRLMKEIPMDFQSEQMEAANGGVRTMVALLGWDAVGVKRPVLDLILEDENRDLITCSIWRSSHRYVHENTVDLGLELASHWCTGDYPEERDLDEWIFLPEDVSELNAFVEWLEPRLEEWLKDKCREIYGRLEEEYNNYQEGIMKDLMEENEEWSDTSNSRYY